MALHEFPFAVPYLEEAATLQFRRLVRYRDALYPGCRVPNVRVLGEMRDLLVRRVSVRGHADHFRCLDEFVCARCRPYRRGSRGSFLLMSGVEMTPEDFVEIVLRFLRHARQLPRDRLAFGELRQGRLAELAAALPVAMTLRTRHGRCRQSSPAPRRRMVRRGSATGPRASARAHAPVPAPVRRPRPCRARTARRRR